MRKFLGSVLLFGAMAATSLGAQNARPEKKSITAPVSHLEVAMTYDALHANAANGKDFWMQGGGVQAEGYLAHGFGVVADLTGEHTANMRNSGVGLDMVTMTFGPRYTWHPARSRSAIYGQALVGRANGFNSVFPNARGADSSANDLALKVGGGLNYTLSRRIAVRAIEADWMRTQLPNSNTGTQDSLQIGTGLILRFY